VVLPNSTRDLLACFEQFINGYFNEINWESQEEFERRCARILPVLSLARIDGKSPVEYIINEDLKTRVRKTARDLIRRPRERLTQIAAAW
jgi:hypothetical protein